MLRGLLLLGILTAAAVAPAAAEDLVPVRLTWIYQGVPPGMKVFELLPGNWKTSATEIVNTRAEVPAAKELKDSTVWVRPGSLHRRVVIVYHNTTRDPLYFFASPHIAEPAEYTLGFKFKCLCTNTVYQVFPGQYWYRILEMWMAPEFSSPYLRVSHNLIAVERGSEAP